MRCELVLTDTPINLREANEITCTWSRESHIPALYSYNILLLGLGKNLLELDRRPLYYKFSVLYPQRQCQEIKQSSFLTQSSQTCISP